MTPPDADTAADVRVRSPWLSWTHLLPPSAAVVLAATWTADLGPVLVAVVAAFLMGAVIAAVHHAEVVAHKVGEPYGSLVLAVAVTVIEVALIVTLMVSGGPETQALARDTVFAAAMITMNGILGLSLIVASRRHGLANFNAEGTGAALATVASLGVLCLVLPTFTSSASGPQFSPGQLAFAAVASLVLYGMFVLNQTVQHRDFFLPVQVEGHEDSQDAHADPPSTRTALVSLGLLLVALVAVVGLAKIESYPMEEAIVSAGLPQSFVGVVIALVVLLPETLAAVRAGARNRTQISLNLALGSAMASIGLTIPAIAVASIWLDGPLVLGLQPVQIALFALTVVVSALTIAPGRATRLQGGVHLVLFAAFLFLSISP